MKKVLKNIRWMLIVLIAMLMVMGCTVTEDEEKVSDVIEMEQEIQEEIIHESAEEEAVVEEIEELPEDSTFSIRYLDVGQADATLIECDGHYMLIDGGNKSDSSKMYTILKNDQIDYLDLVVATHPDEDHVGGLAGALNYATAGTVLCSTMEHDTEAFQDFAKYATKNASGIQVPEIGDVYSLGIAKITILGVNGGESSNDTSIVLKIQYGETAFLFSGDAEAAAEEAVLNSGMDLSATVLQAGHHGSADSTTEAFLRRVMPAYAIISVGADNEYLHPTEAVLERLQRSGAEIYRTDLQGEIVLVSDGKTIDISTEKETSAEELMLSGEAAAAIAQANAEARAKAEAEAKAQEQTRNNETENAAAPAGTDYILNKNTKVFHYPSCKSVKQMKEKNKVYYTGTREEVIVKGYHSCGNCHP